MSSGSLHNAALVIAAMSLSYGSNYQFPPRGQVSWEQAGLLTPWGLIENAYPEVLQLSTTRLGIFDDPKLFILWALVVTLAALKLRRERQTWRT